MGDLTFLLYPTWAVSCCTCTFYGSRRGVDIIPSPTVLKGVVPTTTLWWSPPVFWVVEATALAFSVQSSKKNDSIFSLWCYSFGY
jgi:hypothetical protein